MINGKIGYNNLRRKYKSANETKKKKNVIEITNPKGFFNKGAYIEYVGGIGGEEGSGGGFYKFF